MLDIMRFYILPTDQGKTVCINFDHVSTISINGPSIEIFFAGTEAPMALPKSATTLSLIAKGMDLSDASKDQINSL